ncbi:hypothetical protein EZV62_020322 [Acer yangbiense]|uniref:Uncharacterized protein n=1 Tax=Acer yangbiense TaxID=1000413 RepID=A0A5C7HFU9_9ROSI|nr:hypothetical protein EZV62_020322 [Acer yangbiense]
MESNKENITPISEKQLCPPVSSVPAAPSSYRRKFKRRPRVPLADITNLFDHSIQVNDSMSPASFSVCTSISRKRKAAEDIDFRGESSSPKSSIMGFR